MLLLTMGVALVATAAPVLAHEEDQSYLYLDVGDGSLSGNVQLPYQDLRQVFGLELDGSIEEFRVEVERNLGELQRYAADNTSIGADGARWVLEFDDYELIGLDADAEEGANHLVLPFVVDLPVDEVPQLLEVTFTPFLAEVADRNNLGLVRNNWTGGVIGDETNVLVVFSTASPSGVIDLGNSSQWSNFEASIDLGIDHIRTGPDHIFFLLALVLPSVLILVNGVWRSSPHFRRSLWQVLVVATMFTIAHSITFTLAGLDLLPLPPARFTETLIALSIAAAALHNIWPVLGHREWAIAFAFGLFHGLGFAGFVEDLDIDRGTKLVSLLGRNVGIEIGQAVVVILVFPALFLLSRTRYYRAFFTGAAFALAAVSTLWVFERLFDADYGFNSWIDAVVEWPRVLWLCGLATVAAAVLVWWESRQGRLPSNGGFPVPDEPAPLEAVGSTEMAR